MNGREAHALHVAAATYSSSAWANFVANIVRNVWAHSIIFCGHFPDQTYTFGEDEVADESRGGWYVRQLLGAANIEGGPLFHVISGNLGYQVEHHLYPDMPSTRSRCARVSTSCTRSAGRFSLDLRASRSSRPVWATCRPTAYQAVSQMS